MASLPLPRGPLSGVLFQSLAGNFVEQLPAWPEGGPVDDSSSAAELADEALSRDGRMIAALEDIGRGRVAEEAQVFALPALLAA